MDGIVNVGAVLYGLLLVLGTVVHTPLTEALRIDQLFMPRTGDKGRVLNLIFGLLIAGYGAWGLWKT